MSTTNEEAHRIAQELERCMAEGDGKGLHGLFDLLQTKGWPGMQERYTGPFVPVRKGDVLAVIAELRQRPVGREISTEADLVEFLESVKVPLVGWLREGGFPVRLEVRAVCPEEPELGPGVSLAYPPEQLVEVLQVDLARRLERHDG
jgi:hypothetical protein